MIGASADPRTIRCDRGHGDGERLSCATTPAARRRRGAARDGADLCRGGIARPARPTSWRDVVLRLRTANRRSAERSISPGGCGPGAAAGRAGCTASRRRRCHAPPRSVARDVRGARPEPQPPDPAWRLCRRRRPCSCAAGRAAGQSRRRRRVARRFAFVRATSGTRMAHAARAGSPRRGASGTGAAPVTCRSATRSVSGMSAGERDRATSRTRARGEPRRRAVALDAQHELARHRRRRCGHRRWVGSARLARIGRRGTECATRRVFCAARPAARGARRTGRSNAGTRAARLQVRVGTCSCSTSSRSRRTRASTLFPRRAIRARTPSSPAASAAAGRWVKVDGVKLARCRRGSSVPVPQHAAVPRIRGCRSRRGCPRSQSPAATSARSRRACCVRPPATRHCPCKVRWHGSTGPLASLR